MGGNTDLLHLDVIDIEKQECKPINGTVVDGEEKMGRLLIVRQIC